MLVTKRSERLEVLFQILHHVIELATALGVHSIHKLVLRHDDFLQKFLADPVQKIDFVQKFLADPTLEALLFPAGFEMVLQLGRMKLRI